MVSARPSRAALAPPLVALVVVASVMNRTAAEPSILPVDFYPTAVSADGSVVVGNRPDGGYGEAVWWRAGNAVSLGADADPEYPGDGVYGRWASGVSGDGRVVVGGYYAEEPCGDFDQVPRCPVGPVGGYFWREGASPSNMWYGVYLTAVSGDGRIAAGYGPASAGWGGIVPEVAFVAPFVGVGQYLRQPDHVHSSFPTALSADGSVLVGYRDSGFGEAERREGFLWSPERGLVGLGGMPTQTNSMASGVSADGSVIIGTAWNDGWPQSGRAVRWTDGGALDLGTLPGHSGSVATGVSGDGSLVVGTSFGAGDSTGFIWDEANGMRPLTDVLVGLGVDLEGWQLRNATAISADGSTIVGSGRDPVGREVGWLVTIPEPAGLLPVAAMGGLLRRRRPA
jgi:probable HAF family extracellular repeat protein